MWKILEKRNKEWLSMAVSISKDQDLAKDMVQDMYLRLNKYISDPDKIMKNGEVNPYFIYITLRNIFYDYKKRDKHLVNSNAEMDLFDNPAITKSLYIDPQEVENKKKLEASYKKILDKIDKEVATWHWYDQKLFKLYYYTNHSLRYISENSNISLTSIFNSCKNYKKKLQTKFKEDIEDFFNQDYDKI
jgi:RNA polymerase sigma factor (sigma-70 family)